MGVRGCDLRAPGRGRWQPKRRSQGPAESSAPGTLSLGGLMLALPADSSAVASAEAGASCRALALGRRMAESVVSFVLKILRIRLRKVRCGLTIRA